MCASAYSAFCSDWTFVDGTGFNAAEKDGEGAYVHGNEPEIL